MVMPGKHLVSTTTQNTRNPLSAERKPLYSEVCRTGKGEIKRPKQQKIEASTLGGDTKDVQEVYDLTYFPRRETQVCGLNYCPPKRDVAVNELTYCPPKRVWKGMDSLIVLRRETWKVMDSLVLRRETWKVMDSLIVLQRENGSE
ncbi:hypothetical protein CEXT_359621 [Caerostris extrusa]|uniref:Uncharacterized protein n=1 Tax=Caerostris extrusa TaxID=172846 RepID=A0AAV4SYA7_CAEEX|nr:hypothetical protein CEXT_359621 [Caerostris extrusa]